MTQSQPTLKTIVQKSTFKSVPILVIANFIKLKSLGKVDLNDVRSPYCQGLECVQCPCYDFISSDNSCSVITALNLDYLSEVPWTEFNKFVENTYSLIKHPELYV